MLFKLSAPTNVKVEGNLSVNEGSKLNLNCSYKEGNPPAKLVRYSFGEGDVKILGVVSC